MPALPALTRPFLLAGSLLLGACAPGSTDAALSTASPLTRLDHVFTDHMVIQRDQPVTIWGQAEPGGVVDVQLGDTIETVTADPDGAWHAVFGPHAAGEMLRLSVRDQSGAGPEIDDILVGDVWLCSGQSNMEFEVARALNPGREIAGPHNPDIRLLTIAHDSRVEPWSDHVEPDDWRIATPDSVADFSAVCYFFAREMQARERVPMGLIDASWGGSRIEAWISDTGLRSVGGFDAQLDLLGRFARNPDGAMQEFGSAWEDRWFEAAGTRPWTDDSDLAATSRPAPAPLSDWRGWDDPAMSSHLGMVWYSRTVELTAEQASEATAISLGGIDEVDASWVNGRFIGATFGWGTPRRYALTDGMLQAGRNRIVVNVLNSWGAGGMVGPDEAMHLAFADGSTLPLAGDWHYWPVPGSIGSPPRAPWESVSGLTGMYNGMIAPLEHTRLAGILWYQGESNTGQAEAYESLLNALLADWRGQFGETVPAIIIQLANFGALADSPVESGWARVRDAQRRVAEADPLTGLAITIDIGDRLDIHPPNKQEVARRAALAASHVLHDAPGTAWGARPGTARADGEAIVLRFDDIEGGLHAIGTASPGGFETCAQSGCRFATARLSDDQVILTPAIGGEVVETVRYCWADAPICQLYDGAGLPVGPFEIAVGTD